MEMRALGPDAMLAVNPFAILEATGMVIYWITAQYVQYCKWQKPWDGAVLLHSILNTIFGALITLCVLFTVPCAGVCGLALTLLSVPVFFAFLPVALRLQLHGVDRAIAFCVGEVGFTAGGLPSSSSKPA